MFIVVSNVQYTLLANLIYHFRLQIVLNFIGDISLVVKSYWKQTYFSSFHFVYVSSEVISTNDSFSNVYFLIASISDMKDKINCFRVP